MFLALLLIADLVFLGSYIALVVAGFRTSVRWGLALLIVPLGGVFFMATHWTEGGKLYLSKMAAYLVCVGILVGQPDLLERYGDYVPIAGRVAKATHLKETLAAATTSVPEQTPAPHAVRDLAANESAATPAPAPIADPFAAPRAAYLKHNADLATEYQRLNTERAALKPGTPAVAAFNVKAAHYQSGLQALQKEQAQLDALDHPGSAAVLASASTTPNATGTEAEANAALARLHASVAGGNFAGFAATLRKCLTDYRHTKVFPQIAAYTQQVMRDTPPAKLGATLQLQASAARAEYDATTRKIQAIVNQTPPTVVPPKGSREIYHYAFHAGAIKPDFNVADVVTGREAWNGEYVYMDTRPGVFYRSADCEFNPQTKLFYTDRDVPKKKLTDAENQEIVRLYRILGKDETIMEELPKRLAELSTTSANLVVLNTQLASMK